MDFFSTYICIYIYIHVRPRRNFCISLFVSLSLSIPSRIISYLIIFLRKYVVCNNGTLFFDRFVSGRDTLYATWNLFRRHRMVLTIISWQIHFTSYNRVLQLNSRPCHREIFIWISCQKYTTSFKNLEIFKYLLEKLKRLLDKYIFCRMKNYL